MRKFSLTLGICGGALLLLLLSGGPANAGGLFEPFSGRLTLPIIFGLAIGVVMLVTGIAGLLPTYQPDD